MPQILIKFHYLLLFLFFLTTIRAQDSHNYTDHKPKYRKWLDSYILDKIEYQPSSTIFYFRFVCDNESSGGAIFYPPGGEWAWFLKGRDVKENFAITAVKNVRRDNILIKKNVTGKAFNSPPSGKTGYTIFSCEVHFPRLPDNMNEADLIEGVGQEFNRRHFNCFNIKLKTWQDDLGTEEDSQAEVKKFEAQYNAVSDTSSTDESDKNPVQPIKNKTNDNSSVKRHMLQAADLKCGKVLILDNIKFHDNSTKFNGMITANRTLYAIFNYMKANPSSTLMLYGHSDVFGPKERNMDLSKQRVVKIQRWLTMYGIKQHRINYEWYGPDKPLIPEGDISNRRVEIKLSCNE